MSRYGISLDIGKEIEREEQEKELQEKEGKEGALNPAFVRKAQEEAQKNARGQETPSDSQPVPFHKNYANIALLIIFFAAIIIAFILVYNAQHSSDGSVSVPGVLSNNTTTTEPLETITITEQENSTSNNEISQLLIEGLAAQQNS